MAHIIPTPVHRGSHHIVWTWAGIASGDTCEPIFPAYPVTAAEAAVELGGTWGGAEVHLHASEAQALWLDLNDDNGAPLIFTADTRAEFSSAATAIKPHLQLNGTGANLTVSVTLRAI